jgi:hypothetical protein
MAFLHYERKNVSEVFIVFDLSFDINFGRATLGSNFDVNTSTAKSPREA